MVSPSTVRAIKPIYVAIFAGWVVDSETGAIEHVATVTGRHVQVEGSISCPPPHVFRQTQEHFDSSQILLKIYKKLYHNSELEYNMYIYFKAKAKSFHSFFFLIILYLGSRAQLYLATLFDLSQWQRHLLGSNIWFGAHSLAVSRQAHLQGDRWCSSSIVRQDWNRS